MAYPLLGFFLAESEKYPDLPEGFAQSVGWMIFAVVVITLVWAWTIWQKESKPFF